MISRHVSTQERQKLLKQRKGLRRDAEARQLSTRLKINATHLEKKTKHARQAPSFEFMLRFADGESIKEHEAWFRLPLLLPAVRWSRMRTATF